MDSRLLRAVLPLLHRQSTTGQWATLEECQVQAQACGARQDLVILLVRHELPVIAPARTGLQPNLVVDVSWSQAGGVRPDDGETLECLDLLASALGRAVTVQVVDGG